MNNLLIYFALPVATIILSAIFETLINCPFKVAGIAFSIYLVVAFALGGDAIYIVATIVYTIISLVTAFIVMYLVNNSDRDNGNGCNSSNGYNLANLSGFNSSNIGGGSCNCRNR